MKEAIQKRIEEYTEAYGDRDCFKTWVENINCGEKYIVWCSYRATFLGRRTTFKYRTMIGRA